MYKNYFKISKVALLFGGPPSMLVHAAKRPMSTSKKPNEILGNKQAEHIIRFEYCGG